MGISALKGEGFEEDFRCLDEFSLSLFSLERLFECQILSIGGEVLGYVLCGMYGFAWI